MARLLGPFGRADHPQHRHRGSIVGYVPAPTTSIVARAGREASTVRSILGSDDQLLPPQFSVSPHPGDGARHLSSSCDEPPIQHAFSHQPQQLLQPQLAPVPPFVSAWPLRRPARQHHLLPLGRRLLLQGFAAREGSYRCRKWPHGT